MSKMQGNLVLGFSILTALSMLVYFVHSPTPFTLALYQTPITPIQMLEELKEEILELPDQAFLRPKSAQVYRTALSEKTQEIINQVTAGAINGAIQKLQNDLRSRIEKWVVQPWKATLLQKVNNIISVLENYV